MLALAGCGERSLDGGAGATRRSATASLSARTVHTPGGLEYVDGQLIVRFKEGTTQQALSRLTGVEVLRSYRFTPDLHVLALNGSQTVEEAIARFQRDGDVLYAEPNWVVHTSDLEPSLTPNDPHFNEQWSLNNTGQGGGFIDADINAPQAWNITTGDASAGVVVVIDTGIDYNHQDLAANMFANPGEVPGNGIDDDNNGYIDDVYGVNTITGTGDPMDDHDHGTHCSGIITARGNNGVGVAGVGWNTRLMGCKFLDSWGSGTIADAVECMDWVHGIKSRTASPINVIATSNSWGGGGFSQPFLDALGRHLGDGTLFVAAAGNGWGNDNDSYPVYPNGYFLPNVISVAASNRYDYTAWFSNYGRRTVHVTAPGEDILSSTRGNTYQVFSGTSMATPHVTGLVALLKAQDPSRTWHQLKNLILTGGEAKPWMYSTLTGKRLRAADTGGVGSLTCNGQLLRTRVRPIASYVTINLGESVDLIGYNLNCGNSAGDMPITFTGPDSGTGYLRDNGVAPDQVARDGMVGGRFTPESAGTYTLSFPDGETLTVTAAATGQKYLQPVAIPFNPRTITGTNLNLYNGADAPVISPFPIPFAGTNPGYSYLRVGSTGTISFTDWVGDWYNYPLPNYYRTTLVAPFWDDLTPAGWGSPNNVFWDVIGTAPNRELVIDYRNVGHWSDSGQITFQVVFKENSSDIEFHYTDVNFGSFADRGGSATVGIQVSPTQATQFSYNTPSLNSGTAQRWSYSAGGGRPVCSSISVTPAGGSEGDTFTVSSSFTDPDGNTDGPFTVQVDPAFAGPGFFVPTISQTLNATGSFSVPATISMNGNVAVAVRVKDKNGMACVTKWTTVTVADVPPAVAAITAPTPLNENQLATFTSAFTDPGADGPWRVEVDYDYDATTFSPDEGFSVEAVGPFSLKHTYRTDGVYTLAVRVTDKDGVHSDLRTLAVTVNDLRPGLAALTGPTRIVEGLTATVSSSFTDPGDGASPWVVEWDFDYDGATFSPDETEVFDRPSALSKTHEHLDSGSHTIALRVRDDDGSISEMQTLTLEVEEVDPVITSAVARPASGPEPKTVLFEASAKSGSPNASADPVAFYLWDFDGDGVFDEVAPYGRTIHQFRDNPPGGDTWNVRLRVVDEDTFSDQVIPVVIQNQPPVLAAPASQAVLEGQQFRLQVVASDPAGAEDPISYSLVAAPSGMTIDAAGTLTWSPTAAQAGPGAGTSHTVTVRASDDDGAAAEATFTITATNVAPTLAALPASILVRPGEVLRLQVHAADPGGTSVLSFSLAGAPAGMSIDSSGSLTWATTSQDALTHGGLYPVTVTVTDDDGASASTSTTFAVRFADADGDGLDDGWELAHGLNPNDPSDAAQDRDGDGISNLDEYNNAGAGPFTPGLAIAHAPAMGATVSQNDVTLTVLNTTDRDSTDLSYVFELYADEQMAQQLGTATVAQNASGLTSVTFDNTVRKDGSSDDDSANPHDVVLADNTWYWWRARATDGAHPGAWTALQKLFLNPVNDAPSAPGLASPLTGEHVSSRTPRLILDNATDPDSASLSYRFEVYRDEAMQQLVTASDPVPAHASGATAWSVTSALEDNTQYFWRAKAMDPEGASTASASGRFTVDLGNVEPGAPTLASPLDGAVIASTSVSLVVNNATDADGDALRYYFELDRSPTFNGADRKTSPLIEAGASGKTTWSVTNLQEDVRYYWRARAVDAASSGDWFVASFTVNATNGAPSLLVLLTPTDGSAVDTLLPTLSVLNGMDVEGEPLTYDFKVMADDPNGSLVASANGMPQGDVKTSFTLPTALRQHQVYYWTARARDASGAVGGWAKPARFAVVVGTPGCSATGTTGDALAGGLLPMLCAVLALSLRRRKPKAL